MFSRYDVYTTVQSIYCYPDSNVLRNKLNIRDKDELRKAEEEFTAVKQFVLLETPVKGHFPHLIDRELTRVFHGIHDNHILLEKNELKQLRNLSYLMSELNIIHPFREGNGRSIRELTRCLALQYGMCLNWGNTDRETLLEAAINSVTDSMAFCDVLKVCQETGVSG